MYEHAMKKIIVVNSKAVFSSLFIRNWQRNFGVRPECPLENFLYNLAELIRGHLVGEKRIFLKKMRFSATRWPQINSTKLYKKFFHRISPTRGAQLPSQSVFERATRV